MLPDTQQLNSFLRTSGHTYQEAFPDGGTILPLPSDQWAAGMMAQNRQRQEQSYRWDFNEQSELAEPRYLPGSRQEPWSTYQMLDSHIQAQPSSDVLLFEPEANSQIWLWKPSGSSSRQTVRDRNARSEFQPTATQSSPTSQSDDSDDTIDRPPPDNPVGPPPQFSEGRSRKRYLNPAQRAKAARMRKERSCWHCVILKYSVGVASTSRVSLANDVP